MHDTGKQLSHDDHDALARLVVEAAWRVDHGHADTVHELFADDGTMTLGPQQMAGREAIEAWGVARAAQRRATRHVCTNMRFVATGPDEAAGTTVLTVYLHDGEGTGGTVAHGVSDYRDTFVRRDGRWLFASRRVDAVFSGPA